MSKQSLFWYMTNDNISAGRCLFYDTDDYFMDSLVNASKSRNNTIQYDFVVLDDNKGHILAFKNHILKGVFSH